MSFCTSFESHAREILIREEWGSYEVADHSRILEFAHNCNRNAIVVRKHKLEPSDRRRR